MWKLSGQNEWVVKTKRKEKCGCDEEQSPHWVANLSTFLHSMSLKLVLDGNTCGFQKAEKQIVARAALRTWIVMPIFLLPCIQTATTAAKTRTNVQLCDFSKSPWTFWVGCRHVTLFTTPCVCLQRAKSSKVHMKIKKQKHVSKQSVQTVSHFCHVCNVTRGDWSNM